MLAARSVISNAIATGDIGLEASRLKSAMAEARQKAVARNIQVEVRFYKHLSRKRPSEEPQFFSWEVVELWDDGNFRSLREKREMDNPVVFAEETEHSTLLGDSSRLEINSTGIGGFKERDKATYYAFRFEPDGSTDLTVVPDDRPDDVWCVTLVDEIDYLKFKEDDSFRQFIVLQIDPLTGNIILIRP